MTMSEYSELPKSDKDEPESDANQQLRHEPTRIVHPPKAGTQSGDVHRRRASQYRPRPVSSPRVNNRPEPVTENTNPESLPTPVETNILSGSGASLNPGQRLRTLENAGKDPQPDQLPETPVIKPIESDPPQTPKPPRKLQLFPISESTHRTYWDMSSAFSLIANLILLAVVLVMAVKINRLTNTLNNLLGDMFNNFVRMDNSVISTTINMPDVPIPVNFNLPVVQQETNVTLTRSVTIKSAHVTISSGALTINNAPATVTLPQGTSLPVSFQIDVPVQTTVLMNLQVPVNIKLAEANSADSGVTNLHTAILGLQDAIGPLYCQFNQQARDYLNNSICTAQGNYIKRSATPNP